MNVPNLSGNPSTKILETASRLFYEQGYRATGIDRIIAEAGVAKASFYYHFSSKEKLCLAYLHQRHQNWFSWLQQEVERHESGEERLLSLFTFLERWLPDSNFRGCAFSNIASEFPSPDSQFRQLAIAHKNAVRDYIRELVKTLNIPEKKQTDWLADSIYLLFEGAITKCQIYRSIESVRVARLAVKQLIG